MKILYTFLFSIFLFSTILGQSEWQEFLSHERLLMSANGHLLIDDTLHIAYNDGLKKIISNQKPEVLISHPFYTYQPKVTRTGINSKEVLLLKAFDYDISGLGLVSLRNSNGQFWGKEQFGYEEFSTDFQIVPDGIISPNLQILDQVIDHNGNLIKLNNGELETTSPSPVDGFHEGLNDNFFAIIGDSLFSYTDTEIISVFHLGTYKSLMNDPYNNSLVIETENQLQWYNYDNFTLIKTMAIEPNSIGIQFIEDGLYQLVASNNNYVVYKYPFAETPLFETIYSLPFSEADFDVRTFEVSGEDLYFVGSKSIEDPYNNIHFHYVQKRRLGQSFSPERADISIDSFSVNQIDEVINRTHAYSIKVRNNGSLPINSFSISTPSLPVFDDNYSFIRRHFDIDLEPSESFIFLDTIELPFNPTQIAIRITGVNYGLDSNNDNDEYIADVISLSQTNIPKIKLSIYPNPTSDILNISGDIDNRTIIQIFDARGQIVAFDRLSFDRLDISKLPVGIYSIMIATKVENQTMTFSKT